MAGELAGPVSLAAASVVADLSERAASDITDEQAASNLGDGLWVDVSVGASGQFVISARHGIEAYADVIAF